jgi:hypothetical protein
LRWFDTVASASLNDGMRILPPLLSLLSHSLRPGLALVALALSAQGAVARNDIEVVEVTGGVVQSDARGADAISAAGVKIRRQAKVRVGSDGRLVLALSNGARVLVEANASFVVDAFVDSPTKGSLVDLRPEFGRYTFALPRQGPGDLFLVRGADGDQHLKARGLYRMDIRPGGAASQFLCLAGEALFTPKTGKSGPVRLKAGEQLNLASAGANPGASGEPMNAQARRAIVDRLAQEGEFKVYPLEQSPAADVVSSSSGGGGTATLSAVLASIEDVVERKTQTNPSPTGG